MPRNLATPRKNEYIAGGIYLLVYLFGMEYLLDFLFEAIRMDTNSLGNVFLINLMFFCVNFIAVVLIFQNFLFRSFAPLKERRFGWAMLAVGLGYGIYYGFSYLILMIYNALDCIPTNLNEESVDLMVQSYPLMMIICSVILAPITEECLFRGLIFAPLCRWKPWVAYIVSSVSFAFLHVMGSIGTLSAKEIILCMIEYIPAGFGLGFAYQKSKSIWPAIILHAIVNLMSVIVVLMDPFMQLVEKYMFG